MYILFRTRLCIPSLLSKALYCLYHPAVAVVLGGGDARVGGREEELVEEDVEGMKGSFRGCALFECIVEGVGVVFAAGSAL